MADETNNDHELVPEGDDAGGEEQDALQTWGESDLKKDASGKDNGTLFAVEAHTGQHPALSDDVDPSVTDSLKKAKASQATMYGPTRPGSAKVGSTHATQFGPTEGARRPGSGQVPVPPGGPGTMHSAGSASGGQPVAPFGGRIVVGTRVGQIEVTGVLGKGGMGEVFRGYHHALDIEVAVKVLPDELSRNDLVRQRFLREARLCVKLDHPNIVRVYNVDEHAGNLFLTMELVEGTDAAHMLKNGGRFKYRRALEIGAACADALGYAQSQGLVHRDVKPHNMLLGSRDGKIKLSDFGLARASASSSHLTMSGQIMGTPHYMSPEQAEAKEVTDKSDVYSLGVTLYHMLTGETPFVGDTPISVAVQHIAKEIMFPEVRFAPFPKELVAVLRRMTAKDPVKRCSAKQAAVWLRKLIEMAPADDIQVAPEAMQTMAPVVRESQAFEAAAKAREEQDERAREAARTMLATVREQQALPGTPEEAREISQQMVAAPARSGKGGWIAAALILVLLGGGAGAGWYFMYGPGKPQAPIIAGSNSGTNPDNTQGGPTTNSARPDNSPPANSQVPANNSPDLPPSNSITTPPPREDSKLVAARLADAEQGLTAATTVAELAKVKSSLDDASVELENASQPQRDSYDSLLAQYTRQQALFVARERAREINEKLELFSKLRVPDLPRALIALNDALEAGIVLEKLNVPPQVASLVDEVRPPALKKLADVITAFDSDVSDAAEEFERQKLYDKADEQLALLTGLKLRPERLAELKTRRTELQIRGLHAAVASKLDLAQADDRQYRDAERLIADADKIGVPPQLKSAHEQVVRSVKEAISRRFDSLLAQSKAQQEKGEYAAAKSSLERAGALPMNSDQTVKQGDEMYAHGVSEQLWLAGRALDRDEFKTCTERLDDARMRLENPGDRTVPDALVSLHASIKARFDLRLNEKFQALLADASKAMEAKEFDTAGKAVQDAKELPLPTNLRDTLDEFNKANEQALAAYVAELIETVGKALAAGDFEAATASIARVEALGAHGDSATKLAKLQQDFATEAIRRHGLQMDIGEKALAEKRYQAVRNALAAMKKIPVDSAELRSKERALDDRFIKTLTDDVNARLKTADDLMEQGQFKEARAAISGAEALVVESELREAIKRKHEDLDARIASTLAGLLKEAEDERKANRFEVAEQKLTKAQDLSDVLSPEQLSAISSALDENNRARTAYIADLFKQLQSCVDAGQEEQGKKIVEILEAMSSSLTSADRERLKRLKAQLTGETYDARVRRMERDFPHLAKQAGARALQSEQAFKIGETITALYASNDGKFGAVGTTSGKVIFYNLHRGTQLAQTSAGRRPITGIGINDAGTVAVAGNDSGALVLFEIAGTSVTERALNAVNSSANGVVFSPDGRTVYVIAQNGELTRFNADTRTAIGSTNTGISRATSMAISPDGNFLAIGGDDAEIAVFDPVRMIRREKLQGPGSDIVRAISFSADSRQMMAGSEDECVSLWNTSNLTTKPVRSFKGLAEQVVGVGFSSDGKQVAAFDNETRVVVWSAASGQEQRKVEHKALTAQSRILVTAGWVAPDGTMLIGTRDGELIHMTVRVLN